MHNFRESNVARFSYWPGHATFATLITPGQWRCIELPMAPFGLARYHPSDSMSLITSLTLKPSPRLMMYSRSSNRLSHEDMHVPFLDSPHSILYNLSGQKGYLDIIINTSPASLPKGLRFRFYSDISFYLMLINR